MTSRAVPGGPGPAGGIEVIVSGQIFRFAGDRDLLLGRDPDADIVVTNAVVSRRHASLTWDGSNWHFRDLGSRLGSWRNGVRVDDVVIDEPTSIHLGGAAGPVVSARRDGGAAAMGLAAEPIRRSIPAPDATLLGKPGARHAIERAELRIGRAPDSDLVLTSLRASRHHAVIRLEPDGSATVVDAGSSNGTFLNGALVRAGHLAEGDVLSFGGQVFKFESASLREYVEADGAWLCAVGVGVTVGGGTRLLSKVSFALEPSSLLGLVGPSGSGKSTLLKALTALQPATEGRVLYGGRDLYRAGDIRARMGYVPQDDLLHSQLTVREALGYSAELRFAADVDHATRDRRVDEVMQELGLTERAELPIDRLSGGQRKRTSVAAELLARPPLLFLDEPTSGLDPGNEEQLTVLLRQLADGGRSVVVATHSLVTLEQCDRVLFLARGGEAVYYGPPAEATEYFRGHRWGETYPQVFVSLGGASGPAMAATYREDPARETYVDRPLRRAVKLSTQAAGGAGELARSDHARQWSVLVRRYVAILRADRLSTLLLLAQAPFFALLYALLYPSNVMTTGTASEATILFWLLVVGATWIGTSNSIREVVKELPILRREHGLGLSPGAYALSKIAVLGVLTAGECAFLAIAGLLLQTLPPTDPLTGFAFSGSGVILPWLRLEVVLDLVLVGLAGMAVGLLLSALVRNADQANFALPLVLVAQIVLSAPLLGSPGPVFAAIGMSSSAQWGTAAVAATVDLNHVRAPYLGLVEDQKAKAAGRTPDPEVAKGQGQWEHAKGAWLGDVLALAAITIGALLAMRFLLGRQLEPREVRRLRRGA